MTENDYTNGFLTEIRSKIESEIDHIQAPTREHILKIVDEVARTYIPIGNMPIAPIHDDDYYTEMEPNFNIELISREMLQDKAFGWDGEC